MRFPLPISMLVAVWMMMSCCNGQQISPSSSAAAMEVSAAEQNFKKSLIPFPRIGRALAPFPRIGRSRAVLMAGNSGGGVDASAALFSGGNGGTPLSFFRSNPNEVKELKRNLIPFPRVGKRQSLIPFPRVGRSGPPADTSEIYDEVQDDGQQQQQPATADDSQFYIPARWLVGQSLDD